MDNAGVHGSNTSTGSGVYGDSSGGPGVRGVSSTGDGVAGESSGPNRSGVYGVSHQANGGGVYGSNTGGGPAVYSNGDLYVTGAYRGGIGNGGAPFPKPAYDSGWQVCYGAGGEITLNTELPPPTYGNNAFFVHLRTRNGQNDMEEAPWHVGIWYRILTDNRILVHNDNAYGTYVRIQIWYIN